MKVRTEELLVESIAAEVEAITADFESRGGSQSIHVLAIASMGMNCHDALDRCDLAPALNGFMRTFVDEAFAKALIDRGWRVERPEGGSA